MKKKLLTILAVIAIAVVATVSLVACSGNDKTDWEYIQEKGKIVVGYTIYEPMNYMKDGQLVGFDTEFTNAVAKKLGVEVEFKEINWDNKVMDLNSKNIDLIWNGMTMTDTLAESIAFSTPYMGNAQVIIVKKGTAANYTSMDSFSGAEIAYEDGGAASEIVKDKFKGAKTFTAVEAQVDVLPEVVNGSIGVIDRSMAKTILAAGKSWANDIEMLQGDQFVLSEEKYAIGIRKEDKVFKEKIDKAIAELKADGTIRKLAEKYEIEGMLL